MACAYSNALSMRTSFTLRVRLDDACPKFLGFARGWEGNSSTNSICLPFLYSVEASKYWALAPSIVSSRSLNSVSLLIICANALKTGSTEGARGATKHFMWSLKHAIVGQTKFIILNSQ